MRAQEKMFNKKLLVDSNIKIIEALKRLDENADKVLFVVDNDSKLLGALTDGDIRRYILSGRSLEDNIVGVYNRNPKSMLEKEYSHENIKKIFMKYKITLIPILNEHHRLISIVSWNKVFSEESNKAARKRRRINVPVVIMAGGKGMRLDPFTKI